MATGQNLLWATWVMCGGCVSLASQSKGSGASPDHYAADPTFQTFGFSPWKGFGSSSIRPHSCAKAASSNVLVPSTKEDGACWREMPTRPSLRSRSHSSKFSRLGATTDVSFEPHDRPLRRTVSSVGKVGSSLFGRIRAHSSPRRT